jgi:hypothetical protein
VQSKPGDQDLEELLVLIPLPTILEAIDAGPSLCNQTMCSKPAPMPLFATSMKFFKDSYQSRGSLTKHSPEQQRPIKLIEYNESPQKTEVPTFKAVELAVVVACLTSSFLSGECLEVLPKVLLVCFFVGLQVWKACSGCAWYDAWIVFKWV